MKKFLRRFLKSSRGWAAMVRGLRGRKSIPPPDQAKEFLQLYETLEWTYASVFAIATSGAQVPLKLYKRRKGSDEEIPEEESPLLTLLELPNESDSREDLFEAILIYTELVGNAFVEKAAEKENGPTSHLYHLRPDWVTIIPDPSGKMIAGYAFKPESASDVTKFSAEQMIHFWYFSPLNGWQGQSSTKAAVKSIINEQYAQTYANSLLENEGIPPGYLTTAEDVDPDEGERIAQEWAQKYSGPEHGGVTPFLPFGIEYKHLILPPRDITWMKMRDSNRERIMACHGVNNAALGLTQNMTFDNYRMQRRQFHQHCLQPKLGKVASRFNLHLLPEFLDRKEFYLTFDFSEILSEDMNQRTDRAYKQFQMGAVTPNQVRDVLGLGESYDDGNNYFVSANFLLMSTLLNPPAPPAEGPAGDEDEREEPKAPQSA